MKKYSRIFVLAATVLILIVGTSYVKTSCDCGLTFPIAFSGAILGCSGEKESSASGEQNQPSNANASENRSKTDTVNDKKSELKVTFVELGSMNCIPCRMMKPVMEKVEKQYPGQVKVIFHDVWTPEGRTSGAKYAIKIIPTQVFLDKNGKEYFRHEGFFPFEDIEKVLKQKGVN